MFADPTTLFALFIGVDVAFAFGVVAVVFVAGGGARRYRRRLEFVGERAKGIVTPEIAATRSLARRQSATPKIDRIARRWLPQRDALAARLEKTGYAISIGQYGLAMVGIAAVVTLGVAVGTRIGFLPSLLVGVFVATALPHLVIGSLVKRRVNAFIAHFPEAIDLMVRALRSGLPITEAITSAGHEITDPVGHELRLVEGGMRLGRELESLLWDIARRIDTPEFRFFIIALSVQRETGGNLAETLANLSEVLRRRRQMRAKVRAMASETRATTMILGGLPVVVIALLLYVSPEYLKPLYTDVRGLILDGVALAMLTIGVTVMTKMAKFEI
jgi:tight adherence protein B